MFESQNLVDNAVSLVAEADGIMDTGTHSNRLTEYNTLETCEGEGLGKTEGTDWYKLGCYLKPSRKTKTKISLELKIDLLEMYLEGETTGGQKKGTSKFTKQEMQTKLEEMEDDGPDRLKKYSRCSKAAPPPKFGPNQGNHSTIY